MGAVRFERIDSGRHDWSVFDCGAGARPRLDSIEADLNNRIETAAQQSWLGDVEQLRVTLTRLREKRDLLRDVNGTASDFDSLLAA